MAVAVQPMQPSLLPPLSQPFGGGMLPGGFQAPQQQARWHNPQHQQAARQQGKQGNKNKRGGKRKRAQQAATNDPVSLNQLRQQNSNKTRRFYDGQGPGAASGQKGTPVPASTPRTAPRAPENTNAFLTAQAEDGQTDAVVTYESPATMVGLDYFGTNEGLITRRDSPASWSDDEGADSGAGTDMEAEEVHGYKLHLDDAETQKVLPRHIKARLENQTAYVAQLEEENLNLRERIYLLQQQLEEALGTADMGAEDDKEASELYGHSPTVSQLDTVQEALLGNGQEEQSRPQQHAPLESLQP